MGVNEDLRILLVKECMTIKNLAEKASKVADKKFTADSISQKLNKGTMKYDEVQFLAKVMGYEIEFKKIK